MIVRTNDRDIEWFEDFRINTNISTIADNIVFTTSLFRELTVDSTVEVLLDEDTPLFVGKIDRVSPLLNSGRWQARSVTSKLVDTCPITTTGEFRNRTTSRIIQSLADPFDIEVFGEDGITFDKYNVELDSTCDSIIAELCIFSGLVATCTSDGHLLLHRYYDDVSLPIQFDLEDGTNCSVQCVVDSRRVASEYEVIGQRSFLSNDNDPTEISNIQEGNSSYLKRACRISDSSTSNQHIRNQAQWYKNSFDASIEMLKVTIPGIRRILKGDVVAITSRKDRLDSAKRLVESVAYVMPTDGKSYTELVLVFPSKYGGEEVTPSEWI